MAFLLPMLALLKKHRDSGFRALIITPTNELASQLKQEALKLCKKDTLRVCLLNKESLHEIEADAEKAKEYDVLITTPLRLVYGVREGKINLEK